MRKITVTASAALAAAAIAGCSAPTSVAQATPSASVIQSTFSATPTVAAPLHNSHTITAYGHVRPQQWIYTGDSTGIIRNATWKSWGGKVAAGQGQLWGNDCKPACAFGHWHNEGTVRVAVYRPSHGKYAVFSYYGAKRGDIALGNGDPWRVGYSEGISHCSNIYQSLDNVHCN